MRDELGDAWSCFGVSSECTIALQYDASNSESFSDHYYFCLYSRYLSSYVCVCVFVCPRHRIVTLARDKIPVTGDLVLNESANMSSVTGPLRKMWNESAQLHR